MFRFELQLCRESYLIQVTIEQSDTWTTSCESQSAQRLVGQAFWMFWISNTYGSYIVNSCVKQVLITFENYLLLNTNTRRKKTVVKNQLICHLLIDLKINIWQTNENTVIKNVVPQFHRYRNEISCCIVRRLLFGQ